MQKIRIGAIVIGVALIIMGVISKIKQRGMSVSIIGGADGPTSIFLAGKVDNLWMVGVIVGLILLVIGIFIVKR